MSEECRHKLKIPLSLLEKILIVLSFTINIGIWGYLFMEWNSLPSSIPSHFNIAGIPDAWSSKSLILSIPIIFTLTYIVIIILARIPQHFNYVVTITKRNADAQYKIARKMLLCIGLYISIIGFYIPWSSIQVAKGNSDKLSGLVMFALLGGTILTLVYSTYKSYKLK